MQISSLKHLFRSWKLFFFQVKQLSGPGVDGTYHKYTVLHVCLSSVSICHSLFPSDYLSFFLHRSSKLSIFLSLSHTYLHIYVYACMHSLPATQTQTHTCMIAYTCAHIHIHACAHTHTDAHTHTHTHTKGILNPLSGFPQSLAGAY